MNSMPERETDLFQIDREDQHNSSLALMSTSRISRADTQGGARRQTESTGPPLRRLETASLSKGPSVQTFRQLLRSSRLLQMILVMIVLGNFFGAGVGGVAIPAYVYDVLHVGASGYGLILATFGIGALMGSLGASSLGKRSMCKLS